MTAVISGGKIRPVGDVKGWPLSGLEGRPRQLQSTKSLELIGVDLQADYAGIYTSQPWVFAVVNKITRNIARLPARALREDPKVYDREPVPMTHPLPNLLSRPYPRGSAFSRTESIVGSLCVYGHALEWKYRPRPGQPPIELWPIDWRRVVIHTGEDTPIGFYEYRGLTGSKILMPDDVVHYSWWSPAGITGTSPLEPLRTTLSLEDAGRRYAVSSFANGVRPSGALVTDRPLGDEARKELKAEIESIHSTPDNAFRMMLLDGGLDWKAFAHTSQEAQTIEHRKLNQIEVCAAFDMPPTMLQILDHATFSNIDEQHRMLYQDTLGPIVVNLEQTMQAQLLWGEPQLALAVDDTDGEMENTLIKYDMDEMLRADIVKRAAAYAAMRAAGGLTVNDIMRMEGRRPIDRPEADAVLIPLNHVALGNGGVYQWATERVSSPPESIPIGSSSLLEQLLKDQAATTDQIKDLAATVRQLGDTDLAAKIAALAGERIELKADRLEHVVHEHKTEHLHESHEIVPEALLAEFRTGLRTDLDRAVEAIAETAAGTTRQKRFEYGDGGLIAAMVEIDPDGKEHRYVAERDERGNLKAIVPEAR